MDGSERSLLTPKRSALENGDNDGTMSANKQVLNCHPHPLCGHHSKWRVGWIVVEWPEKMHLLSRELYLNLGTKYEWKEAGCRLAATLHAPRQFIVIFFPWSRIFRPRSLNVATKPAKGRQIPQTKNRDEEMNPLIIFYSKDKRRLHVILNSSVLWSVTVLFPVPSIIELVLVFKCTHFGSRYFSGSLYLFNYNCLKYWVSFHSLDT